MHWEFKFNFKQEVKLRFDRKAQRGSNLSVV